MRRQLTMHALLACLVTDEKTGRHSVVDDWMVEPEIVRDTHTRAVVGVTVPVRCLDCAWSHVGFIANPAEREQRITDMHLLHNQTRPKDQP